MNTNDLFRLQSLLTDIEHRLRGIALALWILVFVAVYALVEWLS